MFYTKEAGESSEKLLCIECGNKFYIKFTPVCVRSEYTGDRTDYGDDNSKSWAIS